MFRSPITRKRHSLVAIAVATALASSSAWAAEEVKDEAAAEESIEEIIVTGTRRVGMTVTVWFPDRQFWRARG